MNHDSVTVSNNNEPDTAMEFSPFHFIRSPVNLFMNFIDLHGVL